MKHIKLFEQFVESISKSSYSTLKRNDIIKHTDSDIMLRISVVKPKVSGVILNSGAYKGKPIRMGDVIAIKPTEIEEWEMSSLDEASSKLESNKYTIKDFPVGAMVHFNDGEIWQVTKSNKSLLKNKIGGDEITIKPISKPGGDLKIKMDFLNANVVKISEEITQAEIKECELLSLGETNSKIQSNKHTMDESYAGLMPLYKKYIDLAKAGEDYEDEYYFFNQALNRAYNTEADKESVLKKLEDKFGKNPKTAGFSKKK